jgi:serine phosphatase RsbU (regulator of sigma subunit)/GAF domain-containing protein
MTATLDRAAAVHQQIIAELQRQLDERTAERDEALDQQTATAEVLHVINSSPGDLAPVFDAMLERAMRLCEAAFGHVWTYDGTFFRATALRGATKLYADVLSGMPVLAPPGTALGQIVAGAAYGHVTDVTRAEGYGEDNRAGRALIELGGARTLLGVPLRKDGVLLGAITTYRQEVRPFTNKQIALLQNFATQAVIAMENARLLTDMREALDQQAATVEVLGVINSSPGHLAPVFDAILERAMRLCDAAFGILWSHQGERFHAAALLGVPPALAKFLSTPIERADSAALGDIARNRNYVHVADLAASESHRESPLRRATVVLGGARTGLAVPIVKDDAVIGIFVIYRQEVRLFADRQIALLQNFAAQAVIAMENARLISETHEALNQQIATAEVLQVINSSPGNLAPVFEAMVHKAIQLCDAASGTLWTYDGKRFAPIAVGGASRLGEWFRQHGPTRAAPDTPGGRLLGGEGVVHIADVKQDAAYRAHPRYREMADIENCRTFVAVGLQKEEILRGMITVYRQEVRPFTGKQIALLQNFAAQAVIAMENARLLEETRQRQAELRVTFDNMGDGVVMFDEHLRLAAWNRNFQELLDLPDGLLSERPSYAGYLRILAERGEFGIDDIEAELSRRLERTDRELRSERTRPNGRIIEVRRNTVPHGGFVLIYSDITERKRSEVELRAARDAAEAALRDLKAINRQINEELGVARTLQQSILPATFPRHDGYQGRALMRAAHMIGGDFYDVFRLDDDRLGIVVADVSGKGVPAAMFMVLVRTVLQELALRDLAPGACLAEANRQLIAHNPLSLFVTVIYGILDARTGRFTYCSGGHVMPYLLRASGGTEVITASPSPLVGLIDSANYRDLMITLRPGDSLLLVTDGVTECFNGVGEAFGEERLLALLASTGSIAVDQQLDTLMAELDRFAAGTAASDDMTALAVRFIGPTTARTSVGGSRHGAGRRGRQSSLSRVG